MVKEYRYGMKFRGFSPMCQPKGVVRREDDNTGKYYDIIVYNRPLTNKEINDYELEEIEQPQRKKEKKYLIEKMLHKVIEDLPETIEINDALVYGTITIQEALRLFADKIESKQ